MIFENFEVVCRQITINQGDAERMFLANAKSLSAGEIDEDTFQDRQRRASEMDAGRRLIDLELSLGRPPVSIGEFDIRCPHGETFLVAPTTTTVDSLSGIHHTRLNFSARRDDLLGGKVPSNVRALPPAG